MLAGLITVPTVTHSSLFPPEQWLKSSLVHILPTSLGMVRLVTHLGRMPTEDR